METILATEDVIDVIGSLALCLNETETNELTFRIITMLGAKWFVYTTLLPPEFSAANESFRFFIGCKPELCQIYNKRMWMMNDPFFEYARTNTAPTVGSKIKVKTAGQAEIMRVSAEHGFRSGLVVPTHSSMDSNKRMGLLYIGSELPEEIGEPMLLRKRVQFGALGTELLHWWSNRLKQQAMRKFSLLDEEVELLQLSKKGVVANEIAALFDIKVTAAYRKLNVIKEKFNVDKIDQAVMKADAAGLLG
ncbi:helix-turn-helix transcriptional regulator [Collimonas arenae]|nr:autoinducer binding domain-containing protein [Collimonas arenae]